MGALKPSSNVVSGFDVGEFSGRVSANKTIQDLNLCITVGINEEGY